MSRRVVVIIISAVLALLAALLILRYVSQADERAMSDMSPAQVLVVTELVPEGTPAAALEDYVSVEQLPSSAIAADAIDSLDDVAGQVTVSELYPGEHVLDVRFAAPDADDSVEVAEGFHEITIQLDSARVLGGDLSAGDTVGFFVSSDGETRLLLHKVLVTDVQGGVTVTTNEDGTETTQPAAETLQVTLAVDPADVRLVVNAAEFHGVWLSHESDVAAEDFSTIDREDLFG